MYVIVIGILIWATDFFLNDVQLTFMSMHEMKRIEKKWKNEESKSSILDILQLKYIISER